MVNIKLGFTDQLFCNLIMLIKGCKIPYKNLDKSSIVFKKPGILSEKLNTLTSSNYNRLE